ncbi:MAG: GtrA family protein [Paludibacteraceae bacterium]|nr:GtrA family protein [Paludibacteraceae bacterium]
MKELLLPLLGRLIKFCVVGFSGMIVDFFFTWLCKEKFKWNKYISNSIGFVLAATNNYVWNRIWTFQSQGSEILREYSTFFIISLVGLGINNAVIYLLHDRLKLNFYLAKILAIGVVTLWNFGMNYLFTFDV